MSDAQKTDAPKAKAPKAKGTKAAGDTLRIKLVKSTIGFDRKQGTVVRSMGLRRIGHTVELPDTPETRGMILKVRHLVTVE
jgi:large subunit ribosomal protein L30